MANFEAFCRDKNFSKNLRSDSILKDVQAKTRLYKSTRRPNVKLCYYKDWKKEDQGRKKFMALWRPIFGITLILAPIPSTSFLPRDKQSNHFSYSHFQSIIGNFLHFAFFAQKAKKNSFFFAKKSTPIFLRKTLLQKKSETFFFRNKRCHVYSKVGGVVWQEAILPRGTEITKPFMLIPMDL